ncbi:MAG: hypothetical protein BGO34_20265 [Bacteroidia bacterium 44-10]|nr:MAG: hypothetical protein BGO34_20265 [Bacteroidia bacterium 44-10]
MKMRRIIGFYLSVALLSACVLTACDDDDPVIDSGEKEQALLAIVEQYVNETVFPTYKNLADESLTLYEMVVTFKGDQTDANLKKVTDQWIKTRTYWELSEAFLFGPVDKLGIDPHIDTWPLDETEFLKRINNQSDIANMNSENGDIWVGEHFDDALRGFHGIEYIFYKDGSVRSASEVKNNELIYALAVAGDLRNQCVRLEASWAGYAAVTKEKQELIDDKKLVYTMEDSSIPYGENMIKVGQTGSYYKTITASAEEILEGCVTIADEVGELKIGNAYRGDDPNYLESPYSYNSLVDFEDNIISIQNAYLGGADKNNRGKSLSDYVKSVEPTVDTKVKEAAVNAIAKIRAIPYPFEKNFTSTEAGEAMGACADLSEALTEAKSVLTRN